MPLQIYDQDLARVEVTETYSLPPIIDDVSRSPSDGSIPHLAMHSTTKTRLLSPGLYSLQLSCSLWTVWKYELTPGSAWPMGQVEAEWEQGRISH